MSSEEEAEVVGPGPPMALDAEANASELAEHGRSEEQPASFRRRVRQEGERRRQRGLERCMAITGGEDVSITLLLDRLRYLDRVSARGGLTVITLMVVATIAALAVLLLPFPQAVSTSTGIVWLAIVLAGPHALRSANQRESQLVDGVLRLLQRIDAGDWREIKFRKSLIRDLEGVARCVERLARSYTSWRDRGTRICVQRHGRRIAGRYRDLKISVTMPATGTLPELRFKLASDVLLILEKGWWELAESDKDHELHWSAKVSFAVAAFVSFAAGAYLLTTEEPLAQPGTIVATAVGLALLRPLGLPLASIAELVDTGKGLTRR